MSGANDETLQFEYLSVYGRGLNSQWRKSPAVQPMAPGGDPATNKTSRAATNALCELTRAMVCVTLTRYRITPYTEWKPRLHIREYTGICACAYSIYIGRHIL